MRKTLIFLITNLSLFENIHPSGNRSTTVVAESIGWAKANLCFDFRFVSETSIESNDHASTFWHVNAIFVIYKIRYVDFQTFSKMKSSTFPASNAFFLIVVDCPSNFFVSFSSALRSIDPELPLSP